MDQRRLETVRQRAQHVGGAAAAVTAHDHHTVGLVDPAGDLGDVVSLAANSGRGCKVATLETSPSALAEMTSCGSVR